jgi:hypothetical protein
MGGSLSDLVYATKDLIAGDESASSLLSTADEAVIDRAMKVLLSDPHMNSKDRADLLINSWRVSYRVKPPTIDEFLSEEWIGPTAQELFPHIRTAMMEFNAPTSPYRHLVMAPAIGWGKSTLATLQALTSSRSSGACAIQRSTFLA